MVVATVTFLYKTKTMFQATVPTVTKLIYMLANSKKADAADAWIPTLIPVLHLFKLD
jgi:hypothetical protein